MQSIPNAAGDAPPSTRRIRFRRFDARDIADLLALGGDPRVVRHLLDGHVATVPEAAGFILWSGSIAHAHPGLGFWRAATEDDRFLGLFSLVPDADGEVGIGARLLPAAWGRGYALEGGAALCEHAFARLGLPLLVGLCAPGNRSIPPLLARLGFVPKGDAQQFGRPALRFVLDGADWQGPRARRTATAAAVSRRSGARC
ncbi:GNAT family N-acetyltransferase [Coralloluteibacterium thermophilus]|uniref:GNAT family N-acetyltransferase n=1 Tax=Coralloluteibacterium thermophilum TaxID=2707049 RepID=A0ABV9NQ04_9GAMM